METPAREHPHIVPWREAYRAFGSNPKDYPSSIENLVRRVQKGGVLPHINTLVDIYNALSLQYVAPMGGEDLDKIVGDVRLRIAGPTEPAALMLGDKEPKPPSPGEVLYADDAGAICRRWNWREADRTKLTEATRDCILVVEGLPPLQADDMRPIIEELAFRVRAACGGEVTTALLDAGNRTLAL
jgi:DNA/RNA-binding domain of Phe-tRNA-synthetase-like protein